MHYLSQDPAEDEGAMTPGKLKDKEIAALFQRQRDVLEELAAVQAEMRALGLQPSIPADVAAELQTSGAGILHATQKDIAPALTSTLTDPDEVTGDDIRAILARPMPTFDDMDALEDLGTKSAV